MEKTSSNFFEVELYVDELRRMKKKDFFPFVCNLGKDYEDDCAILSEAHWIESWNSNVSLYSCQDGKTDDRLANDSDLLLFSNEVISVLNENKIVGLQYLPIKVFNTKREPLANYNQVANIYTGISCLNKSKSKYSVFGKDYPHPDPSYHGRIRILEKMVLDEDRMPKDLDIFRLSEKRLHIIVTAKFANLWMSHKYSNLSFAKIEIA